MAGRVAVILAPDADAPIRLLRALEGCSGRFRSVVLAPRDVAGMAGLEVVPIGRSWLPGQTARRHAAAVAQLRPDIIEVHDDVAAAIHLGGRFRPVPVVLFVHTDPQCRHGAHDAAARTYLLAQATRVAAFAPAMRARILDGVHPAMRHCALLPPPDGPGGPAATAAALDALRLDALGAWSRSLHGPI
jgi:hypothetical protein